MMKGKYCKEKFLILKISTKWMKTLLKTNVKYGMKNNYNEQ